MKTRALRVGGSAFVSIFFCLESGCGTGQPARASNGGTPPPAAQATPAAAPPPSSPFREKSSSSLSSEAYEVLRARVWDPSRRFKALFKAEVSPKVGAVGRGYLSVWWDGATDTLYWRSSAPIAGSGRGGFLRKGMRDGAVPLPGKLAPSDLMACILGTPAGAGSPSLPFEETPRGIRMRIDGSTRSVLVDREGRVIEMSFPGDERVAFQPGEGVPRRIEANGPDGRAVLTLEAYASWPESEEIPPL